MCFNNQCLLSLCKMLLSKIEFLKLIKLFVLLAYPETVLMKTIKPAQSKMNRLPSFSPLYLSYMSENSIRLAKQASLAKKSTFNSVSLRVVYKTNRPLNGMVKDATTTYELSNVVNIVNYHCGNNYVRRTS